MEAVRDFLKARGIADPKVRIIRILRVDLEGDGEEEVLINATNYFAEDKSDYSAAPFPEAPRAIWPQILAELFLKMATVQA